MSGLHVLRAAAALQLWPSNSGSLIRVQRLAGAGAAGLACTGQPPSPSWLRHALKHPPVASADAVAQEDPYEDVYVREVAFHGGGYLVAQGLTSRAAHTLDLLLRTVFRPHNGLPDEYVAEALDLALVCLRLSHTICQRAGLRRGQPPAQQHIDPQVPAAQALRALEDCITFSRDDLAGLLPPRCIPTVAGLCFDLGDLAVDLDQPGPPDSLILTPFVWTEAGLTVASPAELATTLRHHLVALASVHDCADQLGSLFRQQVLHDVDALLSLMGFAVEEPDPVVAAPAAGRNYRLPDGPGLRLLVLSDPLTEYDVFDPFGSWNHPDLGDFALSYLDAPPPGAQDTTREMRLLVLEGVGRNSVVGLRASEHPGPLLALNLEELRVMVHLDGHDPLSLWHFAVADNELHRTARVLSWSKLDNFAIYRDHDYSYYLGDERPPTAVSIENGSALALRIEEHQRFDTHVGAAPDGRLVPLIALHGRDTSPLYFTHPSSPLTAIVTELPDVTIWVVPDLTDPRHRDITLRLAEAVAYWCWQLANTAGDWTSRLPALNRKLLLNVRLDSAEHWYTFTQRGPAQSEQGPSAGDPAGPLVNVEWVEGGGELVFDHHEARLLLHPDNQADRSMVAALATVLNAEEDALAALVDDVAPVGPKRMIHIIPASDVVSRPGQLPPVRYVQPAATAKVLDEAAAWLSTSSWAVGPVPTDRRTGILNDIVSFYYGDLVAEISRFDPRQLLDFLILRDESLLHAARLSHDHLPSRLACFGQSSTLGQQLMQEQKAALTSAVASRFLVEYVAAAPPSGSSQCDLVDYDGLLAKAADLIARAHLSDAIRYGFSDAELAVLNSGRLGVSRDDQFTRGSEAMAEALADATRRTALETTSAAPPSSQRPSPSTEVDHAMSAEFGFTLTQLADGLAELISLTGGDQDDEPALLDRDEVITQLSTELDWDRTTATALLDKLSLRQRQDFLVPQPEVVPWRYTRNLSYIRRPLIEARREQRDVLICGRRRLWQTFGYWTNLIYSGRMRGSTTAMKRLMGSIRQEENAAFERRVEQVLRKAGWPHTEQGLKRVSGVRLVDDDGRDLGDIDALALDAARRRLLVAEAKDFEIARTPAELANEADALLRGDKSARAKTARRTEWVRSNVALVCRHFGVPASGGRWHVQSVIVTSRDLLTPRVMLDPIDVVPIDVFEEWSRHALSRDSRSPRSGTARVASTAGGRRERWGQRNPPR